MKSERRHELEQNELADWLVNLGRRIQPYQNIILGVIILLAAGAVGYTIISRQTRAHEAAAWDRYYTALDTREPGELEDLAEHYAGTSMANWAATVAADLRLASGCELLFSDKSSARQELRRAVDLYLQVLDASNESALRQRAAFGLGRAYESLVDLDKAIEQYQTVVDRWPDGTYAVLARERLTALQRKPVRSLYDQFAQWEPKPEFDDQGQLPVEAPVFDLDSLPEGPQLNPKTTFGLDEEDPLEPDEDDDMASETDQADEPSEADQ